MPDEKSRMALPVQRVPPEHPRADADGWRLPVPRAEGEVGGAPGRVALPPLPFSERDVVLLRYLARGASTADVARALSVSRNTARTRIRRVAAKLDVHDRGGVVRAARGLGVG